MPGYNRLPASTPMSGTTRTKRVSDISMRAGRDGQPAYYDRTWEFDNRRYMITVRHADLDQIPAQRELGQHLTKCSDAIGQMALGQLKNSLPQFFPFTITWSDAAVLPKRVCGGSFLRFGHTVQVCDITREDQVRLALRESGHPAISTLLMALIICILARRISSIPLQRSQNWARSFDYSPHATKLSNRTPEGRCRCILASSILKDFTYTCRV